MSLSNPDALAVTRPVLRLLVVLNLLVGLLILVLLIATLLAEAWVMKALGAGPADGRSLVWGMRLIMVLGISAVPLTHVVLTRLLAIVETVRAGDPFVAENAVRLRRIAWTVLGLELLHLAVGAVIAGTSSQGHTHDIDWNFSVTRWLAVLLAFVLARVFEQGTRMREDLAGTV
jgi:hypothetical protein